VNVKGRLLKSFTHVRTPHHLSVADDDNVLVADCYNDRVLLLDTKLQLQPVIDNNSELKLWEPTQLCYNPDTSGLYVAHSSSRESSTDRISLFRLR